MKRLVSFIFLLLVIIVGILFAVLNAEKVAFNYYFGQTDIELSKILVITLAIGALLGIAASMGMLFRARREIARIRKTAALAEKEITNLRSIPIKDRH